MDERIKNIKETSKRYCTCHNKIIEENINSAKECRQSALKLKGDIK